MRNSVILFLSVVWFLQGQGYQQTVTAGEAALARGDCKAALNSFQTAQHLADTTFIEPAATHQIFVRYAEVCALIGEYNEAERIAQAASKMPLSPELKVRILAVLARNSAFHGDFRSAQASLSEAGLFSSLENRMRAAAGENAGPLVKEVGLLPRAMPPASSPLLPIHVALYVGKYTAAEAQLAVVEPALKSDPLEYLQWSYLKARLLVATERPSAALKLFRDVCSGWSAHLGDDRPDAAECWGEAGAAAYEAGQKSLANDWLRKGAALLARYPENHPLH